MTATPAISFRLDGRVALVTGGASGIGAGIVRVLAEAGAMAVIADRDLAGADRVVAELAADGFTAGSVAVDLTDEASIVHAVAETVSRFGAPWVLVNNAGLQDRQLLLEGTAEEWDRMNRVNARGPFLMTREVARTMIAEGKGGRIVNIASTSLRGQMVQGLACYTASKGALLALGRASAMELADHGITVNTILPGGVGTPGSIGAKGPATLGPGRRRPPLGTCEAKDMGAAALFFASPAARHVTNQVIAVDAGFSIT